MKKSIWKSAGALIVTVALFSLFVSADALEPLSGKFEMLHHSVGRSRATHSRGLESQATTLQLPMCVDGISLSAFYDLRPISPIPLKPTYIATYVLRC
ncbi:MAG: hypothetical protein JWO91_1145 [Acidobacteriaceae bacterium]|jgi:hypothetical protein|nr:hypothetical protein [Acidobacteriaceae bacterium]